MPDILIKQIHFEIQQIDKLLITYKEALELSYKKEPDLYKLTSLASLLHSFYNGIENIFIKISKEFDKRKFDNSTWHRDLLTSMTQKNELRNPIIANEEEGILEPYLSFRHYYRHSYSFYLKWDKIKELVFNIEITWKNIKNSLQTFTKS